MFLHKSDTQDNFYIISEITNIDGYDVIAESDDFHITEQGISAAVRNVIGESTSDYTVAFV